MLIELEIKNFILINHLKINFDMGLNIITGETGSGKSSIIKAFEFLKGDINYKNLIRDINKPMYIKVVLENNDSAKDYLNSIGIINFSDEFVVLTREVSENKKSISRINGSIVNKNNIKDILFLLVDIHSQHKSHLLFNKSKHIDIIDALFNKEENKIFEHYKAVFKEYDLKLKEYNLLINNKFEIERHMDILNYQIQEIDDANLEIEEEEAIIKEIKYLENINQINETVQHAKNLIKGDNSISYGLKELINNLNKVESFDTNLKNIKDRVQKIDIELEDLNFELSSYDGELELEPERLNFLDDRMKKISDLKRKYGNTIKNIIEYKEKAEMELSTYLNNKEKIAYLKDHINKLEEDLKPLSNKLSTIRIHKKEIFENKINKIFKEVELNNTNLYIDIKDSNGKLSFQGKDIVEFKISTNNRKDFLDINKIVSGGELSRIMLAIKVLISDIINTPVFIFDEIDTGVSGKIGEKIGLKLRDMSQSSQIIAITHLPQIAALGDSNFLIEKISIDSNIESKITKLSQKEKVNEIAKLLSGKSDNISKIHAENIIAKNN